MILINIYRSDGRWYGARWIDGEYDGCDELVVPGDATSDAAESAALAMPLAAEGPRRAVRVRDLP